MLKGVLIVSPSLVSHTYVVLFRFPPLSRFSLPLTTLAFSFLLTYIDFPSAPLPPAAAVVSAWPYV